IERLIEQTARTGRTLPLKRIDTGGAPVFASFMKRLSDAAPQAHRVAVYGSTEAEPISHQSWDAVQAEDLQTIASGGGLPVGRPVRHIHLRIIRDQSGQVIGDLDEAAFSAMVLPDGQVGEIVVSGDHVLGSYFEGGFDEQTKFSVGNARWHRTGDAGRIGPDGRLWLLGRCLGRCGPPEQPLYPFAVEAAADATGRVQRCALTEQSGKRLLLFEPATDPNTDAAGLAEALDWAALDRLVPVQRIPLDARHNAKVDYTALKRLAADSVAED
ncbi:MAG: AMP-binding protein, partial [Phycisphaeraceae bacterium]|nr:AMP-binding protein [Phycisphaeraceae bacterium]